MSSNMLVYRKESMMLEPILLQEQPSPVLFSPDSSPDVAQLAWAAGFLDGEACIHIAKQRYKSGRSDTYRLGVHITQNDRPSLEELRDAIGIQAPIYKTQRAENHSRQCYTLNFNGRKALHLLQVVGQHLRRKRREADTGLRFWVDGRMGMPSGGKPVPAHIVATREHYYQLMKRLK